MKKNKVRFVVAVLLISSFLFRIALLKWDMGYHMHPDERELMIVADKLHFFDNLNPHFFSYGTLPLYFLKGIGQLYDAVFSTHIANYDGLLYIGRFISSLFDSATVFFIFLIGKDIFKRAKIGLLAGFFYAIAFFPIQNSHFFVVDVFLTFFFTVLVYLLLKYIQNPRLSLVFGMGAIMGLSIATKFSAMIAIPFIGAAIILTHRKKIVKSFRDIVLTGLTASVVTFIGMPYAFLDYKDFIADISSQTAMSHDSYIFPYTLQYVGSLPYLYYLKNIFFWGVGPVIGVCALFGIYQFAIYLFHKYSAVLKSTGILKQVLWICFYLFYFAFFGISAVKFMRYMLPSYPFIALLAGYGIFVVHERFMYGKVISIILIIFSLFWTSLFLNIYTTPNTRIQATNWILTHIPQGSKILTEHWDDRLPLIGQEKYTITDLTLYDLPDDQNKWTEETNLLQQSDYIIIASNRLYVPLQKLADCTKFKKCYPLTAAYYKNLFDGNLGYTKVAEFTSYPRFSLGPLKFVLPDDTADESFTVYDHPKIMIFRKSQ